MADPVWPAETAPEFFGEFETSDFIMDEIDTNIRTGNAFPIEDVRQESDITIYSIEGRLRLWDETYVRNFKDFYKTTLENGTLWFRKQHPELPEIARWRFLRPSQKFPVGDHENGRSSVFDAKCFLVM